MNFLIELMDEIFFLGGFLVLCSGALWLLWQIWELFLIIKDDFRGRRM